MAARAFQEDEIGATWRPHYSNNTAWELEPGVSTFQHDLAWGTSGPFISDIPSDFGFEIGDKLRNDSLPVAPIDKRPYCIDRVGSQVGFWAKRSDLNQPLSWTVMIPGQNGSYYKAYWDNNNASDSCREMEFAVGIGYPQRVIRTGGTMTHIFTEVRASRGAQTWSDATSSLQSPSNDCNDIGKEPESNCMGLNFPRGAGAAVMLKPNTGKPMPGSWHWSGATGVADYDHDKCSTYGKMREAYRGALGGITGPLRACATWAYDAARGGQGQNFAQGRMYWHPAVDGGTAHGVWGEIGNRYLSLGAENSPLLYPTTNEMACPSRAGCAFNRFETGNIYWSGTTGAHGVWGAIFTAYGNSGYENGRFGLPVSSEFDVPDGRQVNFEHGWIRWLRANGEVITS